MKISEIVLENIESISNHNLKRLGFEMNYEIVNKRKITAEKFENYLRRFEILFNDDLADDRYKQVVASVFSNFAKYVKMSNNIY